MHKLLIDTATSEFFFCREFFDSDSVYKGLFVPIVQVVESDLAESLQVGCERVGWGWLGLWDGVGWL